jgi:hypothetical protein
MRIKFESESLKRRDHLEDQEMDGRYSKIQPPLTDRDDIRIHAPFLTKDFLHRNSDRDESTFHL